MQLKWYATITPKITGTGSEVGKVKVPNSFMKDYKFFYRYGLSKMSNNSLVIVMRS